MIKYFCDPCGKELKKSANRTAWFLDFNVNNPHRDTVPVKIEALVTISGTTNGGHICEDCVIKVFTDGVVREKTTR